MIVASGTAMSQGREAIRLLEDEGVRCGLIKIKTLRPWPEEEIREATRTPSTFSCPNSTLPVGWRRNPGDDSKPIVYTLGPMCAEA